MSYSQQMYGSPPPELSNNPFIDHPTNAHSRYPDITGADDPSASQFTSWARPPASQSLNPNPTGYFGQAASSAGGYGNAYQPQQQTPQPQQWNGTPYGQQQQYGQPSQIGGQQFQPSSSFGQQLAGQMNGAYGQVPQQQQQQQYSQYPQVQSPQYGPGYQPGFPNQQQAPTPYLAEFDPLNRSQSAQMAPSQGQGPAQQSQYRKLHPREYVQSHKAELEAWDSYSWKQAQNCFDDLKGAWEGWKTQLEGQMRALGGAGLFGGGGYGGGYNPAQQYAQCENLLKEANSHIDTIAACTFQFHEVQTGYRQSGDMASKRRVREAINAALSSLPDWPPQ